MNYYSHHIGDFDRATRHLSRLERSVYRDLLDVYYDTEQPLTLDLLSLCRKIIARSNEESTAVEQVLNEFFTETPVGWYHDRCEEEIEEYRCSNSQKSAAGKASAAKRALKKQQALNGIPTSVEQALNERSTDEQRLGNGSATNQEPITNNHKPVTSKNKRQASGDDLLDGVDQQVADDFRAMRKKLRADITKTAMDGIKREAAAAGLSLTDALKICCERGWRGFKAEWILQPRASPTSSPITTLGRAGQATAANAQRLIEKMREENEQAS